MRARRLLGSICLGALAGGCLLGTPPVEEEPAPEARAAFSFAPIDVAGVTPRWGASVADGHLLGGVDDTMRVTDEVFSLARDEAGLSAASVGALDVPRFCGCALYDEGRGQLVMLGGRDDFYRDETSAVLIDVDSGERTPLEHGGAADHPVGCQAFFSPAADRGYVFGGADSSGFSSATWRWEPEARTFSRLEVTGPPGRYDAGVVPLADGGALLASGMGQGGLSLKFHRDVWRFDAASETWSLVASDTDDAPPGRRYPWLALSPDEGTLLLGFGSDSPRGESVLGDLWRLDLATGAWRAAEVEGELPAARGFTFRLPGTPGTAGVLAFGSDAALNLHADAFALAVPDELAGEWR
ncbi:MAG: hypothetical protein A2138_04805 [Deltaproteobacteria bacterium RBG_16_71_12]|nr:MAG: hypothetical protein A2138_04805 [Deltaproteobacteria bacterium RBG_16_71_12]